MFVRINFWLVLCLFAADIAQPGYLKFWQPDLSNLSNINIRLPSLNFNNTARKSSSKTSASTCSAPDNDLEAVLQARFGCKDASSD